MKDFLKFSKRLELSENLKAYSTKNGVVMDIFGVITTLSSLGLLDVEACKKYLDGENKTVTEADKRFKELQKRLLNGEGSTEEIQEYMRLAKEKYK